MRIIITDLTKFNKKDIVCIAGINPKTNECIRPRPYIAKKDCQKRNILPGAIIEGKFTSYPYTAPHTEDRNRSLLTFRGPCSSEEFKHLLKNTSIDSVEEGFGIQFADGQKYIPHNNPPDLSIITLTLYPDQLYMVKDKYNKLRVNFTQHSKEFSFLSVTDLRFCNYAERNLIDDNLYELNNFIHTQQEIYLRLGLSRLYKNEKDGRSGFWLQVNGIYTFPEYFKKIRCYE
ncbi:hypothetical protein GCAAIG_06380 [Candidatus Electronema halotolerans]